MNNAIFRFQQPKNEPVLGYAPGSNERRELERELKRQYESTIEIPLIIGGKEVKTGKIGEVVRSKPLSMPLWMLVKSGQLPLGKTAQVSFCVRRNFLLISIAT